MNKPFFSIIIPTLNEEKYLPLLLKCLHKQTYKNFEVFVVDGKSEDKTLAAAKLFQKKIKNLKLIKSLKRNVPFQRNLGAKSAKGQYLTFIDADVVFDKNTFKKTYQYIKKRRPDIFYSQLKFQSSKIKYKILSFISSLFFQLAVKLKKNLAIGQYLVIKKSVFQKINGYNESLVLSEEHDLIKRARKNCYHCELIKTIIVAASPRRIEKQGIIKFLLKYLYFIIYEHIKGPIYNQSPLNYPMGGHHYD